MKLSVTFFLLFISFSGFSQARIIHVLVALCDNEHQGIVPVPKKIGNGKDPANNLYWGCGHGVKTFFKKQPDWKLIRQIKNPSKSILERLVFKHRDSAAYLVADAYDGALIQQTTIDFLNYAAGKDSLVLRIDSVKIKAGGSANLICYVGHNGLMDFTVPTNPFAINKEKREVIMLACGSKNLFYNHIKRTGAYPLVWTTNLMCPEAYTLDTAIDSWLQRDKPETTREKSAQTYHQYLKCGINGARKLLVTGF